MKLSNTICIVISVLTGLFVNVQAADNKGVFAKRIYLSGKGPSDAVEWDFHCSTGRRGGEWTKIPVPSNWEQQGFGGYDYGHVSSDKKHGEVGIYRKTFFVPKT